MRGPELALCFKTRAPSGEGRVLLALSQVPQSGTVRGAGSLWACGLPQHSALRPSKVKEYIKGQMDKSEKNKRCICDLDLWDMTLLLPASSSIAMADL